MSLQGAHRTSGETIHLVLMPSHQRTHQDRNTQAGFHVTVRTEAAPRGRPATFQFTLPLLCQSVPSPALSSWTGSSELTTSSGQYNKKEEMFLLLIHPWTIRHPVRTRQRKSPKKICREIGENSSKISRMPTACSLAITHPKTHNESSTNILNAEV
jgi:hypothetical protein